MWICKKCGTNNSNNAIYCSNCGTRHQEDNAPSSAAQSKKWITVVEILAIAVLVLAGVWFIYDRTHRDEKETAAAQVTAETATEEATVETAAETAAETAVEMAVETAVEPISAPEPTPWPTEGESTAGTRLIDIEYDGVGKIVSLTEITANNEMIEWTYVYTDGGSFLYRVKNIGGVNSKIVGTPMPGTTTGYSQLESPVENCVGFTIKYNISNVTGGNGLGDREVMIRDAPPPRRSSDR